MLYDEEVTEGGIGAAIEVHRHLGPGLLECAYRRCLAHELSLRGVAVASEVSIDLEYKGLVVPASYRIDLLVANRVVVEVKAVDQVIAIHEAQWLTYLRLSGLRVDERLEPATPPSAQRGKPDLTRAGAHVGEHLHPEQRPRER